EKLDFFKSFKKRTEEGIPWEETEYYHRVRKSIKRGDLKWSCKNTEEFDKRCENWDRLFEKIKAEGYKKGWHEDEVSVNIGRKGELIFNNGRHRLTFAKLLKTEKIPAKVTVRHKEWVTFKKEILEYSLNYKNRVYEKLTHPDLCSIPSVHNGNRYDIIKEHLTVKKGKLLDIGCHWGYFCHRFEEDGFECYCVEKSKLNLYFLKNLKEAEKRKFKIIPHSIFDIERKIITESDVILALSVFHHFIKKENTYRELIKFLQMLKGKELFFEPHNPEEPQMRGSYKNFVDKEFAEFIVENSSFDDFKTIGYSEVGRPIYKIY
ncbi:MAG: methyltransferase domain-containing protein, partial [candidate division WOR-3 bacterium]